MEKKTSSTTTRGLWRQKSLKFHLKSVFENFQNFILNHNLSRFISPGGLGGAKFPKDIQKIDSEIIHSFCTSRNMNPDLQKLPVTAREISVNDLAQLQRNYNILCLIIILIRKEILSETTYMFKFF